NIGIALDAQELRVTNAETDLGAFPTSDAASLRDKYGVNKTHTGSSPSFFVRHQAVFWYLNLNQDQPLFHNNDKLREAVNWALDRVVETTKGGVKGAQFDILLNGWGQDYPDPYDFINILLSGTSIQPDNNVNLSYFNSPKWNALMARASHLSGQARYNAYASID